MESSNFNLDNAILGYIGLIKNQGSLTGSDADELTGHLYDSTEVLVKIGLSEQEAFMVACKRIGNVELLTEEYGKVNMSLKHNKIWAYLLIGFNMFYGIPSVVFALISIFYWGIFRYFQTSTVAVFIMVAFHVLFIAGIFSLLRFKRQISCFIENKVAQKPLKWVALSFLPTMCSVLGRSLMFKRIPSLERYTIRVFESGLVEFSFNLAALSIPFVVLSMIFSINRTGGFKLKNLFDKPSALLLILFGFVIELFAASTRVLQAPNIVVQAVLFGIFYFTASFLLTYYNRTSSAMRAVLIFTSIGFLLELTVGIMADMERVNRFYTPFFVTALVASVGVGHVLGLWIFNKRKPTEC
ncbi:hypothetical protein SAMN05421827_102121 [Pedobacter terrae]|uniref:Uncharacterized protein n=1 Tax=Pedobacter terrae TaxID=405671 RepID=A0A1G7Q0N4_9SPHI|nr:hypothetical protein [Pedobacter terrae]SDF92137.1 hypothetical protein SAMN05421827_102121 [Pedobacter terrae]